MSLATATHSLELKHCVARVQPIPSCNLGKDELEALLRDTMTADALIVLWQMHSVVWGKWQNGGISLAPGEAITPEYWQELRVFNEHEELHLWRVEKGFAGRYRKDEDEDNGNAPDTYVDSFSRFWGENRGAAEQYVTLVDSSRKLRLVIPAEDGFRWYGLQTRNYVGSDEETGLSGYVDYRFVHIASAEEGK